LEFLSYKNIKVNPKVESDVLKVLTYPNPVLRIKAEPVSGIDEAILQFIDEMLETMYTEDGVGLAAPQVGVSKQIIVLDDGEGPIILINPKVVRTGSEEEPLEEGCLSLPGIRVTVSRPATVTVEGLNEKGESVTIEADGLLARILQHEIDHLNATLIIDHLSTLQLSLIKSKLKQLHNEQIT
jgi:peptide deformylase